MQNRYFWPVVGAILGALFLVNAFLMLASEYMWFDDLGVKQVFMTQVWFKFFPPAVCIVLYMAFALGNLAMARKWWMSEDADKWLAIQGQPPPLEPWQLRGMMAFALGMSSLGCSRVRVVGIPGMQCSWCS